MIATALGNWLRGIMRGCTGTPPFHAAMTMESGFGQLLETFSRPGAGYRPHSDMAAVRWAYDTKLAIALRALSRANGAFSHATCQLGRMKNERALVGWWTGHSVRERATELNNLLGELAVFCDRTAKDILIIKALTLVPASLRQ